MNALTFAWRSLVRQPARAMLGILGIAAVGALLFDMLLLSNGLVLSMEDMLRRTGFDLRVSPGSGAIPDAVDTATALAALPEVASAVPMRFGDGNIPKPEGKLSPGVTLLGTGPTDHPMWTLIRGEDLRPDDGTVLVNESLLRNQQRRIGDDLTLRAFCSSGISVVPPITLRIAGVAEFPFDGTWDLTAALSLRDFDKACGGSGRDIADQIMLTTRDGAGVAAARVAVERLRPDLRALGNDQILSRLQAGGLSYFRQISLVLVTVTIGFAFLLVTVLLTVSVNQRFGEIAALRALGFSQRRVVADVLCESALLVGTGAVLALPLGLLLAQVLDRILKAIPGIPEAIHFFVFQPRAVGIHALLFVVTALLAAAYPMRMVARLPIAATLRKEVVS